MIETSTPTKKSSQNEMVQNNGNTEDLGEDEQSFYDFIQKNLNAIERNPGKEVVARIMNYSRSV